ncbi:histidine kinase [Frankia sp. EI5c]|uniref:sensor histidine kinase n=1 Tax=Frankia sp. EI5c TaxID=683316 RepID=UPI0007C2C824|nr:ATP-binding protein [Frankia sp. EI5c]OAA29198.1 histidine kinase [Frankia sp. EI5c]
MTRPVDPSPGPPSAGPPSAPVRPPTASSSAAAPAAANLPARVLALAARLSPGGPGSGGLTEIARLVGRDLRARRVTIRLADVPDAPGHSWSASESGGSPDQVDTDGPAPAATAAVHLSRVVRHRGTQVGELSVELPAAPDQAERVVAAETAVAAVASVLGGVLVTAALTSQLGAARTRAGAARESIADARHRAASLLESERHALERDLHDGAQLHLVSLQMACALLEHQLSTGGTDPRARAEAAAELGDRLRRTRRLLAETASGVAPAPLRSAGLAAALQAGLRGTRDVTLEVAAGVRARRYPAAVERAVYLACLEAVSNAQKHAPGAAVRVRLQDTYHGLSFTVTDDGPGLADDPGAALGSLRARLESVGGSLRVRSEPGHGATLTGAVPI